MKYGKCLLELEDGQQVVANYTKQGKYSMVSYKENGQTQYQLCENKKIIILPRHFITEKIGYDIFLGNIDILEYFKSPFVSLEIDKLIDPSLEEYKIAFDKVFTKSFDDILAWISVCREIILGLNWNSDDIDRFMLQRKLSDIDDINELKKDIKEFFSNLSLPLKDRYTDKPEMFTILDMLFKEDGEYSYEINDAYMSFMNNEIFEGDLKVTHIKAYSYYGGNSACPCDYKLAEKYLLKLLDEDFTFAANSLGYIYYYGRVNDGVPQYDLAFKYFSISALDGEVEAIYKLSDMFRNGYGVEKNYRIAYKLLTDIYAKELKKLEKGEVNKYADIALRFGGMFERGQGVDKDINLAIEYYLFAKGAMMLRRKYYPIFGDESVNNSINKSLYRLNADNVKYTRLDNISYMVNQFLYKDEIVVETSFDENKKQLKLTLQTKNNNKKLVCNMNNKKIHFTNKMQIIIETAENVKEFIITNGVFDNSDGEINFYEFYDNLARINYERIKVKLYNKIDE